MKNAIRIVFSRPIYIGVALLVALCLFLFALWIPNIPLMKYMLMSENVSFAGKILFLWNSLGYFNENFTLFSRVIIISISVLSGLHIAMVAFYLRKRISSGIDSGIGFFGTVIGMLGIGCATCGSIIISSIFGLSATAGVVGLLPFGGIEFGVIGIIILSAAIYLVAKKITNPSICKL